MRNVSDKSCTENQSTHFRFDNFLFRKSRRLRDDVGKYCRAGPAIDDNMEHAHCMLDACALHAGYLRLQTHSEYVIRIAFPLQQWLHERASVLRYRCTAYLAENRSDMMTGSH